MAMASLDNNYSGLESNFLLLEDVNKKNLVIKTLYRYGKKKHIVETIDDENENVRRWYLIKNVDSKKPDRQSIEELIPADVEIDKTHKVLSKITFTNKKTLTLPSYDPDYGKEVEVPQYGKKSLKVEFSFEVRGQILKMLNPNIS